MANTHRDPDTAERIKSLGPSKEHPDLEDAMKGKGGARPKLCPTCGEPLDDRHNPHRDDTTGRAEEMDRGVL